MTWNSASEFFAMGGYGLYVWGSYLVTLVVMLIEPWLARQRYGRARSEVVNASKQEN
jgi:heme exporter protein D